MSFKKNLEDSAKKSDLDIDIIRGITARALFEFIFFAIILFGIGYFAHCQIKHSINTSIEKSVSRHVSTVCYTVEHQFEKEINGMHIGAKMVEENKITIERMVDLANTFEYGNSAIGILRSDGSALSKNSNTLPEHEFIELAKVFEGNQDVITYHKGLGLLFAVPLKLNGETYAYYQKYNDKNIPKLFNVISYDGEGRITIAYKTGEWTEISLGEDNGKFYDQLYKTPGFIEAYRDAIKDETLDNGRMVKHFDFNDNSYLAFGSYVYGKDFAIFGLVKREVVAAGVDYIHLIMISGTCMFMLLLIMFARYTVKNVQNKELEQEKLMALQASQTKSEFLSNMSHEIRTPINAILGMDEMILRESKESNILEYAENLRHAGVSLLGIVNDILDFSKIEAGKMEIIPVEYQISSVLNDLVNMIQTRANKKGLKFIVNADPKLPSILFGDEIRIKQVITNILTNAVKYTEKGSVTLTVNYREKGTDSIILTVQVKDTGIGIKAEDIEKLFHAFERIEEKRNRTIEGTGLGMNITQQLLHLMHSKLNVDSVYCEGSMFWFEIEQKIISRDPIGDFEEAFKHSLKNHAEYHEKFTAPDAEILVVDDTVMNLTVVKGLLKQTKIKIDTAESGKECLKMVANKKYDVIFLDHRMPEMDGLETLREIQLMTPCPNRDTPVISLTANAISGAREQYLAAGFKDYLTKPINSTHLENMLIKYLPPEKVITVKETDQNDESAEENNLPEWLKNVKGLNIKDGIEFCGGVEDYISALTVYANAIENGAKEIENYFNNADWKNYTTKVHALKSSSRIIGAAELSDRAKRLEDAGNSNYIEEIQQDTKPLLDLYRSYVEKLKPLIKVEENNSDKPLIDDDQLNEAFEAMKDIASSFDYDSLMFVIQSLDEYKLPDDKAEIYKQIKIAAEKLEWTKINELLKDV